MRSANDLPYGCADVLLLRHAPTDWNDQRRHMGWADRPLNPAARIATSDWAARATTGFAGVCCSDLKRARDTAAIIALALGLGDVWELSGLREQDQGAWTGLTKEEIKLLWPDRLRERPRRPVGGEPPEAILRRSTAALVEVATAHAGRRVLTVTHSGVIRILERAMGVDSPPVPHLEGRWMRVRVAADGQPVPDLRWLSAGELTVGRPTIDGTSTITETATAG